MRTLNAGMLAHVDAGKTTLTERLLFAAGVIDAIGNPFDRADHEFTARMSEVLAEHNDALLCSRSDGWAQSP